MRCANPGTDVSKDRIVQIAVLKVFPDDSEVIKKRLINPTIPIPVEASNVHGIHDEDVVNEPTFQKIAQGLLDFIGDSDLAGYNSNKFDLPLLMTEFSRCEIDFNLEGRHTIDVQSIFFKMEPRTLKAAYKFYCGKDLVGAHDAENDICATYEVLKAQIERYENVAYEEQDGKIIYPVKNDLEILSKFTPSNLLDPTNKIIYDEQQREIFNFGKHQGKSLVEVFREDPSYYDWMMKKDFSIFTKKVIKRVWESIHPLSDLDY
ncbi:3'-5' exonuclease [Brunnivagina elsteri]|uniref:DNA polymerase III subunit epsilon n=1 Tax=Brunnivagina elsteri CCALA 953 TaxID=987040 RepID=A0A2A2TN21_9CYAN|nr:3'-5' exonuclease [Calothrix elsteri]PAX59807.1 DNA polymerase III subunit epsilon [Calothrix elsteri CCALA 953]